LFFIVVVVSAWYGGLGPAIVSMVISVVAIVPLYAPPIGESGFAIEDALSIGTFLIVSLVIALVTASREKASRALAGSLAEERRSEARNLAVMDSVAEALVLISPEQRILTVNRRFEELFGVPAAQVLGRRFDKVGTIVDHVFADPAKLDELVTGSIDDTEHFYTEIVVQNWPQPRELELFSTPVLTGSVLTGSVLTGSVLTGSVGTGPVRTGSREAGAHLGRLYVFRDITHEREVDRMKTEFVSLVSHELRTPLTSVKGFTDMILDGDAGDINEEVREFLEIVKSNADRLITLINDLLDISRIESGRIQLKIEPVDLAEIVQAAVAGMQPQIEAKGQSLDVNVDPEATWVQGDRDKLLQVLTNYLSNAHKYTQAGGDIRIMVKRKRDFAHVREGLFPLLPGR
jgi:signal transduction histidine kinase